MQAQADVGISTIEAITANGTAQRLGKVDAELVAAAGFGMQLDLAVALHFIARSGRFALRVEAVATGSMRIAGYRGLDEALVFSRFLVNLGEVDFSHIAGLELTVKSRLGLRVASEKHQT